MSTPEQAERAAALLERLLSDPAYRSEFRADPAGACAAEGLPEVAAQLGRGRALETLEIRESRSSLAGVLMAAALEGASLAVLVDHAQAASTVDPDAAKALAQLTQNGQPAVPPPAVPVDATAPVAGAPPAVDVTTTPGAPLPTDTAPAPPPVEAAPPPPPPVVDPPAAMAPPPAVDVIDSPPPTTTAAVSAGPSVRFLPAVSATDPPPVAGVDQVAPLSASHLHRSRSHPPSRSPACCSRSHSSSLQRYRLPRLSGHCPRSRRRRPRRRARHRRRPESLPGRWGAARGDRGLDGTRRAGRRPAAELPVMASLVESGLHNLTGGDRDSVGFFQMRTGIWDRGAYAGFQQNPELQMRWFIDHALAIKARRIAEGDAMYGQDPSTYGNWVADVEVPDEPYRGRYQLRLGDARALLAQAGSTPAPATGVPAVAEAAAAGGPPVPAADVGGPVIDIAPGVPVMDAQAASPTALNAIRIAAQYLGTPYHFGGASPESGFDCSGLMQWAYRTRASRSRA